MSLYLIVVLIHVFTEAICSKKHPYHMRPISVHKFIMNSAQSVGIFTGLPFALAIHLGINGVVVVAVVSLPVHSSKSLAVAE